MAKDPSRKVRDAVLNPLGWQRHGLWAERLVEYMAVNDPSETLRQHARAILAAKAFERAADAERRRLPDRLRLKTERHPLRWVALDGDQLVAGSWPKATAGTSGTGWKPATPRRSHQVGSGGTSCCPRSQGSGLTRSGLRLAPP